METVNESEPRRPSGPRWLPGLVTLRGYQRSWLRGDVLAGITVAAYLVPQVMAYAGLAGLPPVAGLWAMLAPLLLYAVFGSSRHLSVGPESTTALMTATALAPLAAGDPGRYAALAAALAVVVGLLCVLAYAIRLGFVADLLSKPVLVGYLAGVAMIMIVGQLEKLTGVPVDGDSFGEEVLDFLRKLPEAHVATVILAAVTLALLLFLSWRWPQFPTPLVAVVAAAAAVLVFNLEQYGITVVGEVPQGLPGFSLPGLGDLEALLLPAVGVLVVGYTDTILTARSFAVQGGYRIDSNQELLALGASNVGAGALQGFPISSSGSRTALGVAAGGHTQVYSLVACAVVASVLLLGGPMLSYFPDAALGAIVVYAALRLVDIGGFRRLYGFRRSEFLLALAALLGVLAFDLLYGVLLAVALSVMEMLYRVARPHDATLGVVPGLAGMHDIEDYPDAETIPGLVVYRYDSPLFFANADDFGRRALAAVEAESEPVYWFVLNVEANVEVDITALEAVDQLRAELVGRGIVFAMARVKRDLQNELDAFGLTATLGRDRIFPTIPTAVDAYEQWRGEHADPH